MKFNSLSLAALASLSLPSATFALMGTSCLTAAFALGKFPGRLIENIQSQSCEAGCKPMFSQYNTPLKQDILNDLMQDGIRHTGIHDPAAADTFARTIDTMVDNLASKCQDKFENKHLCHDPESLRAFTDCVYSNSRSTMLNFTPLIPYMSEERCNAVTDYITSDVFWKEDFPEHFKAYVDHCHEL